MITAVTAQNTREVTDWLAMPEALVEKQIDAVLSDIGADAVKTGMLANAGIIGAVAGKVREHNVDKLVVDPVMVAKGGHKLLEDEAVAAANDTEFGLVAYVFTRDIKRAIRVCEGLETGMIGLNQGMVSNAGAPFGGVKQSGIGREGGNEGIHEFLETKYVAINI